MTSVLNSASARLHISILFSTFSGVLFYSFIWGTFFSLLILAACVCYYVLGRAATSSGLGRMTYICGRCLVGSSGAASPAT